MTRTMLGWEIVLSVTAILALPVDATAQKLVVFVRHAERADGGAPAAGMTAPADPDLSAEGKARADRLSAMLADAGISRIVVTEFRRTAQTADPLARRLGLTPDRVTAADTAGAAARLKTYVNDIVLVVGHSNGTPALIAAMGGPKVAIDDADYGNIFVYVPATQALLRLRY
jgi:broad specificity phosphatase PhoE